jgi:phytanoyl-CoA dioxygenase PhyH
MFAAIDTFRFGTAVRKRERVQPRGDAIVLTDEQIRFYHEEGFLSIPSVSTPEEIDWLIGVYDGMFAERVGYKEGYFVDFAGDESTNEIQIPQILGPVAYRPALRDTAIWRNCEAMAKQLLGPDATFQFDHAMLKPPGGGAPTPWHQDQAFYPQGTRYHTITFWIPLQDVGPQTGCLKYVAESHKGPLLEHRPLSGNPGVHGLEALGVVEGGKTRHCPLPAGGCVVHHRLTLHGADRNVTETPRRAYAIAFGVRQRHVVVPQGYPWNLVKRTPSDARLKSSPTRRAKQFVKRHLMRWGLLDR